MDRSQQYTGPRSTLEPPDDADWKQELRHDSRAREASVAEALASPLPPDEGRGEEGGPENEEAELDNETNVPSTAPTAQPSAPAVGNGHTITQDWANTAAPSPTDSTQPFVFGAGAGGGVASRDWAGTGMSPTTSTPYQFGFSGGVHERRASPDLAIPAPTAEQQQRLERRESQFITRSGDVRNIFRHANNTVDGGTGQNLPTASSSRLPPSSLSTVTAVVAMERHLWETHLATRTTQRPLPQREQSAVRRILDADDPPDPGLDGDFDAGFFPPNDRPMRYSEPYPQIRGAVAQEAERRLRNLAVDQRVWREGPSIFRSSHGGHLTNYPPRDLNAGYDSTWQDRARWAEDLHPTRWYSLIRGIEELTRVVVQWALPGVYEEVRRAVDGPDREEAWDPNTTEEERHRRNRARLGLRNSPTVPTEEEIQRREARERRARAEWEAGYPAREPPPSGYLPAGDPDSPRRHENMLSSRWAAERLAAQELLAAQDRLAADEQAYVPNRSLRLRTRLSRGHRSYVEYNSPHAGPSRVSLAEQLRVANAAHERQKRRVQREIEHRGQQDSDTQEQRDRIIAGPSNSATRKENVEPDAVSPTNTTHMSSGIPPLPLRAPHWPMRTQPTVLERHTEDTVHELEEQYGKGKGRSKGKGCSLGDIAELPLANPDDEARDPEIGRAEPTSGTYRSWSPSLDEDLDSDPWTSLPAPPSLDEGTEHDDDAPEPGFWGRAIGALDDVCRQMFQSPGPSPKLEAYDAALGSGIRRFDHANLQDISDVEPLAVADSEDSDHLDDEEHRDLGDFGESGEIGSSDGIGDLESLDDSLSTSAVEQSSQSPAYSAELSLHTPFVPVDWAVALKLPASEDICSGYEADNELSLELSAEDDISPISPTVEELRSSLQNLDNIFSGAPPVDSAAPSPTIPSMMSTTPDMTDYAVSMARIPGEPDPMVFLYGPFSLLYNALDLPHCHHNMRAASCPLPRPAPRPPPPDLQQQNVVSSKPQMQGGEHSADGNEVTKGKGVGQGQLKLSDLLTSPNFQNTADLPPWRNRSSSSTDGPREQGAPPHTERKRSIKFGSATHVHTGTSDGVSQLPQHEPEDERESSGLHEYDGERPPLDVQEYLDALYLMEGDPPPPLDDGTRRRPSQDQNYLDMLREMRGSPEYIDIEDAPDPLADDKFLEMEMDPHGAVIKKSFELIEQAKKIVPRGILKKVTDVEEALLRPPSKEQQADRAQHSEKLDPGATSNTTSSAQKEIADTASIRTTSSSSSSDRQRRRSALGLFKFDGANSNWSPDRKKATASIGTSAGYAMMGRPIGAERRLSIVARDARIAAEGSPASRHATLPPELQITSSKDKGKEVRRDSRKKSKDLEAAEKPAGVDARSGAGAGVEKIDRRLEEVHPMSPEERREALSKQLGGIDLSPSASPEGKASDSGSRFPLRLKPKETLLKTSPERKKEHLEKLELSPTTTEGVYIRSPVKPSSKENAVPGVNVTSPSEEACASVSPPSVPPRPSETWKEKHRRRDAVVLTEEEIDELRALQDQTNDQQQQAEELNERDDLPSVPPSPRLRNDLEPDWDMPRLRTKNITIADTDTRNQQAGSQRGHSPPPDPPLPQRFPRAVSRKRAPSVKKVSQPLLPSLSTPKPSYDEEMSEDRVIKDWARDTEGVQWGLKQLTNEAVFPKYPKPTRDPEVIEEYLRESVKWSHQAKEVLKDGREIVDGKEKAKEVHEEKMRRAQERYGGELIRGTGGGLSLFTEAGQREGGRLEEERLMAKRREDAERQARAEEESKTSPLNIHRRQSIELRRSSSLQTIFGPDDKIPESARLDIDDDDQQLPYPTPSSIAHTLPDYLNLSMYSGMNGSIMPSAGHYSDMQTLMQNMETLSGWLQQNREEWELVQEGLGRVERLSTLYEETLSDATERIRQYTYEQQNHVLALHKHYTGLLAQSRNETIEAQLTHQAWQGHLQLLSENMREAVKAREEERRPWVGRIRGLKEENRVLRRMAGWEPAVDSDEEEAEEDSGGQVLERGRGVQAAGQGAAGGAPGQELQT
ncbi:hypothetical protein LTR85_001497 [Meristemomyces frigidus]|nr:hypothetical protein LTR85_001497 [Meristemomyces frigidus]